LLEKRYKGELWKLNREDSQIWLKNHFPNAVAWGDAKKVALFLKLPFVEVDAREQGFEIGEYGQTSLYLLF